MSKNLLDQGKTSTVGIPTILAKDLKDLVYLTK